MDVSDASYYTFNEKKENKGSQIGHTKKKWKKLRLLFTTPMREDLGLILTQTQEGILTEKLSSPFFQT